MTPRFETYFSAPIDSQEKRFILVVYNEGQGKFQVRRNQLKDSVGISYVVAWQDPSSGSSLEKIMTSVPLALEQVFAEGAFLISYVEGDALIEFAAERGPQFDSATLEKFALLALSGLKSMGREFVSAQSEAPAGELEKVSALQLCLGIVLGISGITFWYGNAIVPLDWLSLTASSLVVVFVLACVCLTFTRRLFEAGKFLAISFFVCSAILLMLLAGVISREFYAGTVVAQEGIIESMLVGSRSNIMRIRLAAQPHKTFILSKGYLEKSPGKLPQAIRLQILVGLFGARYVNQVTLIE